MITERVASGTIIPGKELIGRTCRVTSLTQSNTFKWHEDNGLGPFTISEVLFRVSLDGKVITLIHLAEKEGMDFTLKDLTLYE